MGILRIKHDVDQILEKDPYDLFAIDEPHQLARRLRPEFWGAAFLGLLVAFGFALFAFLNVQHDAKEGDTPYAYFEIKAIDPEGHPVAGAQVREGEKSLGVTDSFGEWRRFMRVRLGATVALTMTKKTPEGTLTAVKNIAVPVALPVAGELELSGSVQLARGSTQRGVPVAKDNRRFAAQSESSSEGKALAAAAPGSPSTVGLRASVWFVVDGKAIPQLTEVVQALKARSLELGMRVDPESTWRVHVADMLVSRKSELKPERRLIIVDAKDVAQGQETRLYTFLRDYQDSPLKTARDILWAATMHTEVTHRVRSEADGTYAVVPAAVSLWALTPGRVVLDTTGKAHTVTEGPQGLVLATAPDGCASGCDVTAPGITRQAMVSGWEHLRLRMDGVPAGADVYASGYEARRIDAQTFEYWGAKGQGANVAVVQGGRLIFRSRVEAETVLRVATPGKQPVRVSKPRATTL